VLNIDHEFLDSTQMNVSGVEFEQERESWFGEVSVGGSYEWHEGSRHYMFYGELSTEASLSNTEDNYQVGGTVGFRVRFYADTLGSDLCKLLLL
jgi:fibronectin-binding autotransporter adhesin